jgi:hypothetical protein
VRRYTARFQPLLLLREIMVGYFFVGVCIPLGLPADFIPLQVVSDQRNYFLQEGYIATLLYHLIPLFLLKTEQQKQRKQRRDGGRLFKNRFTPADLQQKPADEETLRRTGSDGLFQMLKEELRLFLRLLRAAQLAYQLAPTGKDWRTIHDAACIVLLRLAQISSALRHKGHHLLAEECFRWQAREIWRELFGQAPKTEEELEWLEPPQGVTPSEQKCVLLHLLREWHAGRPIAAPLAERFAAWYREPL